MSEVTVYECDVTGERYEERGEVIAFSVVRKRSNGWDTWEKDHHVHESLIDSGGNPNHIQRIFVERDDEGNESVVAYDYEHRGWNNNKGVCYEERDSVMVSPWDEKLFELVEREILHGDAE